MGLIFGGSTTENREEIEELKSRVEDAEGRVRDAESRARRAHDRAAAAEERAINEAENAAKIAHALNALHAGSVAELEDKDGVVETLDEPRIAWKSTEDHIVKLLLPEGATVVHPENSANNKKRGDEAIPLAFYDTGENVHRDTSAFGSTTSTYRDQYVEDDPNTTIEDSSMRSGLFKYEIGEPATPEDDLDTDVTAECRSGIHFFPSKDDALGWHHF